MTKFLHIQNNIKQEINQPDCIDIKPNKHQNNYIVFYKDYESNIDNNNISNIVPNLGKIDISFSGNNNLIFIVYGQGSKNYKIQIYVGDSSCIYIGKDNYYNSILKMIITERCNMFIGNNCLFSFGILVRTADPHLIYDADNNKRINFSKSVFIGDHAWIGQNVSILKGAYIGSGCIIGASSLICNKKYYSNTIYGGNPARFIKDNVFFDSRCVHNFKESDTEKYSESITDTYNYKYDSPTKNMIYKDLFDILEEKKKQSIDETINFCIQVANNNNKDRFVILEDKNKVKFNLKNFLLQKIIHIKLR